MKINHTINFILDREKGKDDCKLRMRVRFNNECVAVNLGYRIDPSKWSADACRCKSNSVHGRKRVSASEINQEIQRYEIAATESIKLYEVAGKMPSAEELRGTLRAYLGRKAEPKEVEVPPMAIALEYIQNGLSAKGWSVGTANQVKVALKSFCTWLVHEKQRISDISNMTMMSYNAYLELGGKVNRTIMSYDAFVGSFLRWCEKKGYCRSGWSEEKPKLKVMQKTVIWLTWDELMAVTNLDYTGWSKTRQRMRHRFLFACFTGLRVSDILKLRWGDIQGDTIVVGIKKTSVPVYINLNRYSRAILDLLRTEDRGNNDYIFDGGEYHNKEFIEEICREAGITTLVTEVYYQGNRRCERVRPKCDCLSMHSGRRTFICNALEMGITPQVIMKWTGHSNYESMKPYIDISDHAKAVAMEKFDR